MAEKGRSHSGVWWLLLVVVIQVTTVLILIPSTWLEDVVRIEDEMLYSTLGEETAATVEQRGYRLYASLFIQTGVTSYVQSLFIPTEEERARSRGLQNLGQEGWFPWLEGRGYALQLVLIQACERFAHIYTWIPIMLMIFVPAAWDGYMNWQMKRTSMGYSSPFWHRLGMRITMLTVAGLLFATFLPFPLPPVILPVAIMIVLPILGSLVIANFPKRV
jgi:hypothetical protein